MAGNDDKVLDFVTQELEKDPEARTSDLFEKAKDLFSSVEQLSLRQFNARFPLQVKRKKSRARSGGRRRGAAGKRVTSRDAVREVFLRFASDLTAADEKKDLVKVLAELDTYIDDAIAAARRKRAKR